MTPERHKWWNSLPAEEKRVRLLIKTLKNNIICCKQSISDEWNAINADMKVGKNQLEAAKTNLRDTKRTIKFLRRQISQRPRPWSSKKFLVCPCCRKWVYEQTYCKLCGQKLRWE